MQFDIDVLSDELTCGWLISEVTRRYTEALLEQSKTGGGQQWMPVTAGSHNPVHNLI